MEKREPLLLVQLHEPHGLARLLVDYRVKNNYLMVRPLPSLE